MQKLDIKINEDSVFKKLSKNGLISFSDYIFLVTLLSSTLFVICRDNYFFNYLHFLKAPTRHFEIAFHMFDLGKNLIFSFKK